MLTKDVPVRIRLKGAAPAGYRVTAQTVTPEKLGISGPESRVAAVDAAETDAVDVSGLTQGVDRKVNAYLAEPRAQFQTPPEVMVKITIEKVEGAQ
jgi:YbbR domain-containing protein